MSEFKIEKGFLPLSQTGDRTRKYPFNEMEIGDSFHVPDEKEKSIRNASLHYGKKHKMKFSTRMGQDGFRCWRTA